MNQTSSTWFVVLAAMVAGAVVGLAGSPAVAGEKEQGVKAGLSTAPLVRGELVVTVRATGTLEPEEVIDVGTQVAGRVESLGKDASGKAIDYNSAVEEGTVLARIDDAVYKADVEQTKAGLARAEAEVALAKVKLDLANLDLKRAQAAGKAVPEDELTALKLRIESARAGLAMAQAGVAQAGAALRRAELNCEYTVIRSPAKGTIIARRVNVGQTVMASLNAPSLFLIADLKHMQVWATINETDIGQVKEGQPVSFTVDAYPNKVFKGEVAKVRLNAAMNQNVVTYTVVIQTDNAQLLPYLTANVQIVVARKANVLLAPNAALRWRPQTELRGRDEQRQRVWVRDGQGVRAIEVRTGLNNGSVTEITGGDVKEGMEVIVGGRPAAGESGRGPENAME